MMMLTKSHSKPIMFSELSTNLLAVLIVSLKYDENQRLIRILTLGELP